MMWKEEQQQLVKEWKFKDFIQAFAFVTKVSILAEKQNHHPQIILNYNHLKLSLTTHDQGNVITEKDRKLAEAIDRLSTDC